MKYLSILCMAFTLAGCASLGDTQLPTPVDGKCGATQDMCILGTPSGTGDTSSPYGWVCLGRHGGANDTCSVPTAPVHGGEIFAGQRELVERVKAAGPMRGQVTLFDWTYDSPACDPNCHGNLMKSFIKDMGIPEGNINVDNTERFLFDPAVIGNTLVAIFPTTFVRDGASPKSTESLRQSNLLVVASGGNTDTEGNQNRRDLWYPDHPLWTVDKWERSMTFLDTGKVILAKWARQSPNGTIVPDEGSVKCGMVMEYCYSIIVTHTHGGTSGASAFLGALTFYLFQLWETPQEVIGVLNTCAEDVGEPGIDEEFGRGIVSVVCDTIQHRELGVVADSMTVLEGSPVMAHMTGPGSASGGFRPFYSFRGYSAETATGYVGGRFSEGGTDFFMSGGAGYAPLGVYSSLLRGARRPFVEFGSKRSLFSRGAHAVFLLGTYGYGGGSGLSAHAAHLGARYERRFVAGVLALDAGYRRLRGRVGIPGHREADAEPVLFTDGEPEVKVFFSLGL